MSEKEEENVFTFTDIRHIGSSTFEINKNNVIYVVVTMMINDTSVVRSRAIGWFSTKEAAIKSIVNNDGDMYECGYYNYGVVEPTIEGLYGSAFSEEDCSFFYVKEYNPENNTYVVTEVERPQVLESTCSFGIG